MQYNTDQVHQHELRRSDYEGVDVYVASCAGFAGYGDYHGVGIGQLPIPPQILGQIQSLLGQMIVVDDTGMQSVTQPTYVASALDQLELKILADVGELVEGQAGMPSSYPNAPWITNRVNQGYVVMVNPASLTTGKLSVRLAKNAYVVATSTGQELGPASYVIVQGPPGVIAAARQVRQSVVPPAQPPPAQPPIVVPPVVEPPIQPPPGPPGAPPPSWWEANKNWVKPAAAIGGGGLLLLFLTRDSGAYRSNPRRRGR